ncbi:hypothetical protein [Paenibacillus wynnii]|uniref:Polymerase nucleotidyl transferase domain-containing protein n=1 Tax=Paenibacillus wynnii TaxID=268407 RepID=A0A098M3D9_9BACL|nr:hypothetical protein [Paenibacillus wynnii]KGE16518.1 hypothetical protein PWYN_17465 [Paenibacillus wynnii]
MIELVPISKSIYKADILNVITYKNEDIVFASGSLVQGIGNGKSDLDLFVITQDFNEKDINITYDQLNFKVGFNRLEGVNCDIEYWLLDVVEELIDQVNSIDFGDINVRSFNQLKIKGYNSPALTSFLHRFIISKNIYNDTKYKELYEKLNKNNYFRLMARIYVNHVDNAYDDVVGNLEQHEYETAYLIARETLLLAMTAYVFSMKQTIDRTKWTYKMMKVIAIENQEAARILNKCNEILFPVSLSKGNLENSSEQALSLINSIISSINDAGGV